MAAKSEKNKLSQASSAEVKYITVRQNKSSAGADKRTLKTLQSVGLGRIGKQKTLPADPAVLGKIEKLRHLVDFVNVDFVN